jgi:hypothetical protein
MYWINKFKELNEKYWGGSLTEIKITVRDLEDEGAEGLYHYPEYEEHDDGELYISTSAFIEIEKSLPHNQKVNILLHEMSHHAVEEFYDYRPYHNHGKEWRREMVRCGFKGKIHHLRGNHKTK